MKVRKYLDTVWCQCLEARLEHGLFFYGLEGVPVSEAMVVTKVVRQLQSSGERTLWKFKPRFYCSESS